MPRVTTFVALCALTGGALAKCASRVQPSPAATRRCVRLTPARPTPCSMDHAFVIMDERRRARRADELLSAAATAVRSKLLRNCSLASEALTASPQERNRLLAAGK